MTTSTDKSSQTDLDGTDLLLECRGITKRFGAVRALKDVHFDLRAGEVHALLGQNGAGKSTLIKILSGAVQRDAGEIFVGGSSTDFKTPAASRAAGISIVYQELSLVPTMSVSANLFLAREPRNRWGGVKKSQIRRASRALLEQHDVPVDPRARVETLPFAFRQLIEIVSALSGDIRVLVLDEPTSALTGTEEAVLFDAVQQAVARGVGVIYVTHRMSEVFRLADRVTVLRDGSNVGTYATADTDLESLVSAIVGSQQAAFHEVATFGLGPHGEQASSPETIQLDGADVARVRDAGLTLSVLLHTMNDWSRQQLKGLTDTAAEFGIDLLDVFDAEFDASRQIAHVDRIIASRPDLVVAFPVDTRATADAFRRIDAAGIRLILMDQSPHGLVPGQDYACVVSTDNYACGAEAARLLVNHIPPHGIVGIGGYRPDFFPTVQRQRGFERWLRDERPDVDLVQWSFDDPSHVEDATRQFLGDHDVDGLFVAWDEPALGVSRVLEELGRQAAVVTVDLGQEVAGDLARGGHIVGVVAQHPYELGVAEVRAAAAAWLGRELPPWIALAPRSANRESVAQVYADVWREDPPVAIDVHPPGLSRGTTPSEMRSTAPAPSPTTGDENSVLELRGVSNDRLRDVSLVVRPGEIVGLAGLIGSGRTELLETVFGLRQIEEGSLLLDGEAVRLRSPADAIARGVALAPEDRYEQGLVLEHSIERNVALPRLSELSRGGLFRRRASRERAAAAMGELSVKAPGPRTRLDELSGGNQQKIVFGKWRDPNPVLLLLDEPTAGVDVGARDEIYGVIHRIADEGAAVLVASSEFAELLLLCDRIALVSDGAISGEFLREEVRNEDNLNQLVQRADR